MSRGMNAELEADRGRAPGSNVLGGDAVPLSPRVAELNYRHAFHAGNFADILKHAAILMTLSALQARQPRLTVIDTHAGSGVYALRGPAARKSNEAQAGVLRLMAGPAPAALEPLKRQVAALNEGGETGLYPGSPP